MSQKNSENSPEVGDVESLEVTDSSEEVPASNVIRLNFGSSSKASSSAGPSLNAIVARGKRIAAKVSDEKKKTELNELLSSYQSLLESALDGQNNDDQVEEVEDKLLDLYEELES